MTEKRYYAHKHLINEDKVHDKVCHRFMNISETVEHMNMYYQKYTALKKTIEIRKFVNTEIIARTVMNFGFRSYSIVKAGNMPM